MRALAPFAMAMFLGTTITSCAAAGQQMKSSANATCADSCKNQPADTQGQCIAQCTK